ncbi:MAG TPA: methyltransferase domain-containing protein [Pseudonocardiaceae bacterium]|nr:methyltransferase domain-containing protein [Pseudonocardiaceae bacterium]
MAETTKWQSREVGKFYDDGGVAWFQAIMGDNSHVGLWTGPDDTSSLREASNRLTDLLIDKLNVGKGERVLDLGCGVGGPAARLAARTGAEIVGVAISAAQVEMANKLAEAEGLAGQARFELADAMGLPFPDNSFDHVLMFESIMHMPSRLTALAEAARVIRPGGRVVLTDLYERTEVTPDRASVVAKCLDGMFSTAAGVQDYPRLLTDAGLRWVELADITDQSWTRTHQEMAKEVQRMRPELDSSLGGEFLGKSDELMSTMWDIAEIGYLVATAQL